MVNPFWSTLVNPFDRLQDPDTASSTRDPPRPLAEQLAPLHSTAEVAELQAAVASIPPGTPARAERLWKLLSFGKRTTIGGIQELLARQYPCGYLPQMFPRVLTTLCRTL